ncbi:hypothetical protein QW060_22270 [Myroides ceti]|uniref:Uncharacterized protein n=1 Tax=Paenimyroides ceti TaxID=395087 RepID=A0ABT8D180_9FLAO|nr:hypothetical protein [Paenimyroides ceti]MDN3709686.1 hypothetical protein [Paenimyroides ceti]
MSGYALGNNAMGKDISGFLVEAHKSNTSTTSNSARYNENEKIDWQYLKSSKPYLGRSRYAKYHYHSHPDNSLASDDDKLNFKGKSIPHFIISKKYNQQYNDVNVFEANPDKFLILFFCLTTLLGCKSINQTNCPQEEIMENIIKNYCKKNVTYTLKYKYFRLSKDYIDSTDFIICIGCLLK